MLSNLKVLPSMPRCSRVLVQGTTPELHGVSQPLHDTVRTTDQRSFRFHIRLSYISFYDAISLAAGFSAGARTKSGFCVKNQCRTGNKGGSLRRLGNYIMPTGVHIPYAQELPDL